MPSFNTEKGPFYMTRHYLPSKSHQQFTPKYGTRAFKKAQQYFIKDARRNRSSERIHAYPNCYVIVNRKNHTIALDLFDDDCYINNIPYSELARFINCWQSPNKISHITQQLAHNYM